ncbi:MAG: Arm DNA-binding domain-containing protein [Gammaproteobacteria bacterium]
MKANIASRTLAALTPKPTPYEVRDTKLKGFLVRVQPSGIMSYIVEYGRGKRITLGRVGVLTPTQAQR